MREGERKGEAVAVLCVRDLLFSDFAYGMPMYFLCDCVGGLSEEWAGAGEGVKAAVGGLHDIENRGGLCVPECVRVLNSIHQLQKCKRNRHVSTLRPKHSIFQPPCVHTRAPQYEHTHTCAQKCPERQQTSVPRLLNMASEWRT